MTKTLNLRVSSQRKKSYYMSNSQDDVSKEPILHEVTDNVVDDDVNIDDLNIADLNIGGNTGGGTGQFPNAKPLSAKQSSDQKQK